MPQFFVDNQLQLESDAQHFYFRLCVFYFNVLIFVDLSLYTVFWQKLVLRFNLLNAVYTQSIKGSVFYSRHFCLCFISYVRITPTPPPIPAITRDVKLSELNRDRG